MTIEEIKRRTKKNICSIGCYKDLEFLIAKIERMQAVILEQVSIEHLNPKQVRLGVCYCQIYFRMEAEDLREFFDVEVK